MANKIMLARFVMGLVGMVGIAAHAGAAGIVCPQSGNPADTSNGSDNDIPVLVQGQTVTRDCFTGPNFAQGVTRARGQVKPYFDGSVAVITMRAYLWAPAPGDPIQQYAAKVFGWDGFNLVTHCLGADYSGNAQWGGWFTYRSDGTNDDQLCTQLQHYKVVALG